jgi:hypothetical protein
MQFLRTEVLVDIMTDLALQADLFYPSIKKFLFSSGSSIREDSRHFPEGEMTQILRKPIPPV